MLSPMLHVAVASVAADILFGDYRGPTKSPANGSTAAETVTNSKDKTVRSLSGNSKLHRGNLRGDDKPGRSLLCIGSWCPTIDIRDGEDLWCQTYGHHC
jgi:hypothetical protein